MSLAVVGARARGFHHDTASKLQRLIMAVAELDELIPAESDARPAVDGLHSALGELEVLFADFRALARGADAAPCELRSLLVAAARRAGARVAPDLDVPDLEVRVREPEAIQVVAGLIDGPAFAPTGRREGDRVVVAFACRPDPGALALAAGLYGATRTPTGVSLALPISK